MATKTSSLEQSRRQLLSRTLPAGTLVYEVTSREHFDPVRFNNEKGELRAELLVNERARYGQSVLNQLRQTQNVEINPRVLGYEQ